MPGRQLANLLVQRERFRQRAEQVVPILHALRQSRVHFLIDGVVVDEIQHVYAVARLADAFDSPDPLLQP